MLFLGSRLKAILLYLIVTLLCVACGSVAVEQAPIPTVPEASNTPDHWSTIQAAGKIVVGTSADYPPFASYDANFVMTGFDIDLMTEIGRRLGMEVEFRDFAFEGLLGALRLNQIDAAIAAISVTPEREAEVDFSNVYYVGQVALVTLSSSMLRDVRSAEELAGLRVGVQSGSVYADWAQRQLVETGLISVEQLRIYRDITRASEDLKQALVDVLILDLTPAQKFVQDPALKIVAQGIARQSFAIAIPEGDALFKTQLDSVMAQLQAEGFVAKLAEQYLALDHAMVQSLFEPLPASSTLETPEKPKPFCIDGMALVQDLTMDNMNMTAPPILGPGLSFKKGWRVQNNGTCVWSADYGLYLVAGARMGDAPLTIGSTVPVDGLADFYINMVAPGQPGLYQSIWQMRNDEGVPFGERLVFSIQVSDPLTPNPVPLPTPTK